MSKNINDIIQEQLAALKDTKLYPYLQVAGFVVDAEDFLAHAMRSAVEAYHEETELACLENPCSLFGIGFNRAIEAMNEAHAAFMQNEEHNCECKDSEGIIRCYPSCKCKCHAKQQETVPFEKMEFEVIPPPKFEYDKPMHQGGGEKHDKDFCGEAGCLCFDTEVVLTAAICSCHKGHTESPVEEHTPNCYFQIVNKIKHDIDCPCSHHTESAEEHDNEYCKGLDIVRRRHEKNVRYQDSACPCRCHQSSPSA